MILWFRVPNSKFRVLVRRSSFVVRGSGFVIRRSSFVVRSVVLPPSLGAAFSTFRLDSLRVDFGLRGLEVIQQPGHLRKHLLRKLIVFDSGCFCNVSNIDRISKMPSRLGYIGET